MFAELKQSKDGLSELMSQLEQLNAGDVLVGVPESENKAVEGEPNFNMASLAAVLEFGNQHIPSRPFLRQTLAENQQKYTALFVEGINNGEDSAALLNKIALIAQGDVQENMVKGGWTPNAQSTIKRKKSSKPLIDTGKLRQSIRGIIK